MKIIKPGILADDTEVSAKCDFCACEFTFTPKEAKVRPPLTWDSYPRLTADCPSCGLPVDRHINPKKAKWLVS